ncbi:MAG: M10 family metallopeptidase C-terminal domain-containing protein [Hyphomicrobiales bacterium]|nr:M10 family metallopeptidase C-terminal domain-containing protein [Hyphomicrobiales bacterium]
MCQLCIESSLSTWERNEATAPGVLSTSTNKTVWNNSQVISQLDSGYHWSGSTITYSLPTNANWFPYSEANGFSAFNATQRAAANSAIELWDDLIAVSFTQTTNASTSDIEFSNTTTNISYAHAYYPGGWSGAGSIWLNDNYTSLSDPDLGEYGFMTVLHELGHALGLDHAGDYNGGSPTYQNDASHAQDSTMYTVMSYFGSENTGADWWFSDGSYAYAQTPMVHDILAIQDMYGADQTTRSGNTVYGFNSNAGNDIFDFNINQHPVLTIWDGGGTDTINLSGYSDASIVDLRPGSYSDVFGAVNNLAIAYGAWIENAIGGSGDDRLTGHQFANTLRGLGGYDTLRGLGGNDVLLGGGGNDSVYGHNGRDRLVGHSGADKLYGGNDRDTLNGGSHNDRLHGGGGNDRLIGGLGNDTLIGGGDADTFVFNKSSWGDDVINDFQNGSDKISMRGSGFKAGDLHVVNSNGDAIVDFGNGDTITLLGEAGNIESSDFIF